MNKGAYILIFFFWALLTIITPILVQWSAAEAAQAKEDKAGEGIASSSEGANRARKMMELFQEVRLREPSPELAPPPPEMSPAPAPGADERTEEPKVQVRDEEGSSNKVSTNRKLLQIRGSE